MMHFIFILLGIVIPLIFGDLTGDVKILEKCLRQLSTPDKIASDLEKLEHYGEWQSEEVPCLMRCLANEKGWFDIEGNRWYKQRLVDELGADVYNYCRYELQRKQRDGCTYAHRGLRCLKEAEVHAGTTITMLLRCARQLNATNAELLQYSKLKAKESIPCLFECFAGAMGFYDSVGNWQLHRWRQAFGPTRTGESLDFTECRISDSERGEQKEQKCAWMYEEYRCFERINGNLIIEDKPK